MLNEKPSFMCLINQFVTTAKIIWSSTAKWSSSVTSLMHQKIDDVRMFSTLQPSFFLVLLWLWAACVPMGIILLFPLIYNGSISIQKSLPMGWVFSTGLALQLFHLQLSYLIIELQLLYWAGSYKTTEMRHARRLGDQLPRPNIINFLTGRDRATVLLVIKHYL